MALIKTSEELRVHFSSMDKNYTTASLQSFIDDAEKDILIPWIGQGIFDVVKAAYAPTPTVIAGKKAELLVYLQKAITHLSLLLASDSGSFRISDAGFYVVTGTNNKPVSDKKMSEFKKGRRESGYNALEQAVEFLEANIDEADFAAYKASDQHLQNRQYFINSAVEFTKHFKKVNNSAYLFNQLKDALGRSERKYVKPVLGNAFFFALKAKVLANTLTGPEKLLLPYINRALANYTIATGLPGLNVEIDGQQLTIGSSPAYGNSENVESKAAASPVQINSLIKTALDAGNMELEELQEYLIDHAADFAAYIVPEASEDFEMNDPNDPVYFVC